MAKIKKKIATSNAGKDAEKLDHSYIAGGNVSGTASLENSLAVSYKDKIHLNGSLYIICFLNITGIYLNTAIL